MWYEVYHKILSCQFHIKEESPLLNLNREESTHGIFKFGQGTKYKKKWHYGWPSVIYIYIYIIYTLGRKTWPLTFSKVIVQPEEGEKNL